MPCWKKKSMPCQVKARTGSNRSGDDLEGHQDQAVDQPGPHGHLDAGPLLGIQHQADHPLRSRGRKVHKKLLKKKVISRVQEKKIGGKQHFYLNVASELVPKITLLRVHLILLQKTAAFRIRK